MEPKPEKGVVPVELVWPNPVEPNAPDPDVFDPKGIVPPDENPAGELIGVVVPKVPKAVPEGREPKPIVDAGVSEGWGVAALGGVLGRAVASCTCVLERSSGIIPGYTPSVLFMTW